MFSKLKYSGCDVMVMVPKSSFSFFGRRGADGNKVKHVQPIDRCDGSGIERSLSHGLGVGLKTSGLVGFVSLVGLRGCSIKSHIINSERQKFKEMRYEVIFIGHIFVMNEGNKNMRKNP